MSPTRQRGWGLRPAVLRAQWERPARGETSLLDARSPPPLACPMPLTLEQYAAYLDTPRPALAGPAGGRRRPRPSPHLGPLPGVRAVLWNVYGTLLAIPQRRTALRAPATTFVMDDGPGEDDPGVQDVGLDVAASPGSPSEYMRHIYDQILLDEQRLAPAPARSTPRSPSERRLGGDRQEAVPEGLQVRRRLLRLAQRVQPQGRLLLPRQPARHRLLPRRGRRPAARAPTPGWRRGCCADGQCFTTVQLQRGLAPQDDGPTLDDVCSPGPARPVVRRARHASRRSGCSARRWSRWRSRHRAGRGAARRLAHRRRTSCRPRRLGMRTALFAGDKASLAGHAGAAQGPGHAARTCC